MNYITCTYNGPIVSHVVRSRMYFPTLCRRCLALRTMPLLELSISFPFIFPTLQGWCLRGATRPLATSSQEGQQRWKITSESVGEGVCHAHLKTLRVKFFYVWYCTQFISDGRNIVFDSWRICSEGYSTWLVCVGVDMLLKEFVHDSSRLSLIWMGL